MFVVILFASQAVSNRCNTSHSALRTSKMKVIKRATIVTDLQERAKERRLEKEKQKEKEEEKAKDTQTPRPASSKAFTKPQKPAHKPAHKHFKAQKRTGI
jgi:mRNA deadenylase 3'-5' endonuclease subunit Ccr4